MSKASFSELLKHSPLLRPSERPHTLKAAQGMNLFRDEDGLVGKIEGRGRSPHARSGALGGQLSKLLSGRRAGGGVRRTGVVTTFVADPRQRVIVTVFYQGHGGGGAAKLLAHGEYLERDGAGPEGEPGRFYDRDQDEVESPPRLSQWAEEDKRHMRLMLAPESGARFEDLKDFTRATMARMERDLGAPLDWMAVNHYNTDNTHVHVILRGRRRDGPDLIIPRDYATWGLRHAARDIATEMLGERGIEDERRALERESRAERATRLDRLLEAEIKPQASIRIQAVGRDLDPTLRAALRNRVRELARMGLAREEKRGRFRFEPDWAARLERIGAGIDIRRRLGRERAPGEGRLRLYAPSMGRVAGELVEIGQRGEGGGKAFVIVRDAARGPVFVNVRGRAMEELAPGALIAVEPKAHQGAHPGRGVRVRVQTLSALPLDQQIGARAETELDREMARALAGQDRRLPQTQAVREALLSRMAWHEREGSGRRDLTGRFEFAPGALERLRSEEWSRAAVALGREAGKRVIGLEDGMEREWRVRRVMTLHQGRFAALERNDAVALMPLMRNQQLEIGKSYSIAMAQGKVKAAPSLGLER